MSALSDFSEALVLDWLMTNGAATRPTAWYIALFTAAPSDSGGGTEVSGSGYAREAVTFSAASSPQQQEPVFRDAEAETAAPPRKAAASTCLRTEAVSAAGAPARRTREARRGEDGR